VLQSYPKSKSFGYHGINSQFWGMHIRIDNGVNGHGAKARDALKLY
jgi:hypothetical protein